MNIQTLSKKSTWELKLMVKALSSPVSLFLNDEKAEERLKNAKIVLENRERAEEIRQRKIAIQRVDAQTKSIKKW
jgi:hypothetical protein